MEALLLFALIVFVSYFVQSITGFGASIFTLALGSLFVDTHMTVLTISIIGSIFSLILMLTDPKGVNWKEYLRIVFYCAIGMPLGLYLFNTLDGRMIKRILGALMVLMSAYYLIRDYAIKKVPVPREETLPIKILLRLMLVAAGIVHGATVSGGPLIVAYMTLRIHDKRAFRQTLGSLWVALNSFVVINGAIQGRVDTEVLTYAGAALPLLILGTWLGKRVYEKVSQKTFMLTVYIILLLSGIIMFF